jgi:hypothetical protein
MTLKYIDRYYQGYGRYLAYSDKNSAAKIFGAPRWLWRQIGVDFFRYWGARLIARPKTWMDSRIGCAVHRGMLDYYRHKK